MSPADDDSTNITTFDKQRLEEVHPLVDRLDLWALSLRDLRLRSFAWRPSSGLKNSWSMTTKRGGAATSSLPRSLA